MYFLAFAYFLLIPEDEQDVTFRLHSEPLISQLYNIPNTFCLTIKWQEVALIIDYNTGEKSPLTVHWRQHGLAQM